MIEDEFNALVRRVKELQDKAIDLEHKVMDGSFVPNDVVEIRQSLDNLIYDIDNNNLWDSSSDYDHNDGWKSSALNC